MEGEPVSQEFQQGLCRIGLLWRHALSHACQFLQKVEMKSSMVGYVAGIQSDQPHHVFFFLEVILGIVRQLFENCLDVVESHTLQLCEQVAETVDQIDESVVLPVYLCQTGFKVLVPMK